MVHTVLMALVLRREQGGLRGFGISRAFLKAFGASIVTGIVAYFVWNGLVGVIPAGPLYGKLLLAGIPGLSGLVVYVGAIFLLDMKDAKALRQTFLRR